MFRFYSNPTDNVRVSIVGDTENGVLRLASARCSKKDQFIRKKGRAIAEGRLRAGKTVTLRVPENQDERQFFIEQAAALAERVKHDATEVTGLLTVTGGS